MDIKFTAIYGEEEKEVRIYRPNGVPTGSYYVSIDNYNCGQFVLNGDTWNFYGNSLSEFTSDDIDAMRERILEYEGK